MKKIIKKLKEFFAEKTETEIEYKRRRREARIAIEKEMAAARKMAVAAEIARIRMGLQEATL